MVKKLKELAEDAELANAVRSSAQQIWQAGLGAFAKAQEEGGRVFSRLVKEGTEFQKRAEDKVADVSDSVGKLADGVGKQASGSWDKLEQVFEERVARALAAIGVPTQQDLAALHAQIDALSRQVAALSAKAAPAPRPKAAARPAVKAAPKAAPKTALKTAPKAAVAKAPAKPAARTAPRAAARPTSKPVSKPAAKKKAPAA
ncbi:phasin family protein [Janthinobacterium sp. NKUCC06_STL]|uniref:phasin family protein n=1 Tax=Janthinobacterium sp. NKUCC06_STL TaxID=2842127 RepID=UPI001C5B6C97|nr:phasin family protein [Janthinobacterium sp. NKUCC06_STL]MBW3510913.1 phasin family protein [Janthinobacterium sp. NKUCC06_STL]